MSTNLEIALEAALDAAAPTGSAWVAGEATFVKSLNTGSNIETALVAALDAAAAEKGPWVKGYDAFYQIYNPGPNGRLAWLMSRMSDRPATKRTTERRTHRMI